MSRLSPPTLLAESILPIFLVFGSKYISIFVINLIFSFSWSFSFSVSQVFSLPFIRYENLGELVVANSVSSFIMSLVLAVGYIFVFFRFQHFHEKHVHPKISAKLHSQKMEQLIISDELAHHQISVWYTLAWFTFILILLEFLAGSLILFVLSLNLTIVLFLSALVLFDMRKKSLLMKG